MFVKIQEMLKGRELFTKKY